MHYRLSYCATALVALLVFAPDVLAAEDTGDAEQAATEVVIDYSGKLQDENADPVAGLFDMEFKLYESQNAAEARWSERHFVSVVDGRYTVPLGSKDGLRRGEIPSDAWIGVELVGEGELLRDRFRLGVDSEERAESDAPAPEEIEISDETRRLLEEASDGDKRAYADIAERAVSADVALRAERIGDLTAEELERRANTALDKLGEHIADPDAHEATGGLRLGDETTTLDRVGGTGGSEFRRECPDGYVVTGITGSAGRMVDGLRLICRKLR